MSAAQLIILSTSPNGRVAHRLSDIAKSTGISVEIQSLDDAKTLLQRPLAGVVVLPRIAPAHNQQAVKLLFDLQKRGARIINAPDSWELSRDKWKSYSAFSEYGVPTPKTLLYPELAYDGYVYMLGSPFIFKPISGTHGEGIKIIWREEDLPAELGIMQEYIEESAGTDIRVVVVGDKVVAAMRRIAQAGEFRANLHQGATAETIESSDVINNTAVSASRSLGLDVAGVDIVMSANGPLVLEANPSPGLGIEAYTGVSVASAIIEAARPAAS